MAQILQIATALCVEVAKVLHIATTLSLEVANVQQIATTLCAEVADLLSLIWYLSSQAQASLPPTPLIIPGEMSWAG